MIENLHVSEINQMNIYEIFVLSHFLGGWKCLKISWHLFEQISDS